MRHCLKYEILSKANIDLQVSSIEILIATEAKEGLLVWRDRFGLGIKGGKVGDNSFGIWRDDK